jgi:hypothetical protein
MDCGKSLGRKTDKYGELSDGKAKVVLLAGESSMSNRHVWGFCALLVLLGVCGCSRVNDFEFVQGGNSSENDGFWYQDGGLFLKNDSPGVMFGMAKTPAGEREFVYLVVFKHQATATSKFARTSNLTNKAGKERLVTMTDGLGIGSQRIDLKLEIEIDSPTKTVKREHLTFDGKEIDLRKGRLFLVDLTPETAKWEQVQAKLPANLPDPIETKGVRELVKRVLDELPKESEAVRTFLKR